MDERKLIYTDQDAANEHRMQFEGPRVQQGITFDNYFQTQLDKSTIIDEIPNYKPGQLINIEIDDDDWKFKSYDKPTPKETLEARRVQSTLYTKRGLFGKSEAYEQLGWELANVGRNDAFEGSKNPALKAEWEEHISSKINFLNPQNIGSYGFDWDQINAMKDPDFDPIETYSKWEKANKALAAYTRLQGIKPEDFRATNNINHWFQRLNMALAESSANRTLTQGDRYLEGQGAQAVYNFITYDLLNDPDMAFELFLTGGLAATTIATGGLGGGLMAIQAARLAKKGQKGYRTFERLGKGSRKLGQLIKGAEYLIPTRAGGMLGTKLFTKPGASSFIGRHGGFAAGSAIEGSVGELGFYFSNQSRLIAELDAQMGKGNHNLGYSAGEAALNMVMGGVGGVMFGTVLAGISGLGRATAKGVYNVMSPSARGSYITNSQWWTRARNSWKNISTLAKQDEVTNEFTFHLSRALGSEGDGLKSFTEGDQKLQSVGLIGTYVDMSPEELSTIMKNIADEAESNSRPFSAQEVDSIIFTELKKAKSKKKPVDTKDDANLQLEIEEVSGEANATITEQLVLENAYNQRSARGDESIKKAQEIKKEVEDLESDLSKAIAEKETINNKPDSPEKIAELKQADEKLEATTKRLELKKKEFDNVKEFDKPKTTELDNLRKEKKKRASRARKQASAKIKEVIKEDGTATRTDLETQGFENVPKGKGPKGRLTKKQVAEVNKKENERIDKWESTITARDKQNFADAAVVDHFENKRRTKVAEDYKKATQEVEEMLKADTSLSQDIADGTVILQADKVRLPRIMDNEAARQKSLEVQKILEARAAKQEQAKVELLTREYNELKQKDSLNTKEKARLDELQDILLKQKDVDLGPTRKEVLLNTTKAKLSKRLQQLNVKGRTKLKTKEAMVDAILKAEIVKRDVDLREQYEAELASNSSRLEELNVVINDTKQILRNSETIVKEELDTLSSDDLPSVADIDRILENAPEQLDSLKNSLFEDDLKLITKVKTADKAGIPKVTPLDTTYKGVKVGDTIEIVAANGKRNSVEVIGVSKAGSIKVKLSNGDEVVVGNHAAAMMSDPLSPTAKILGAGKKLVKQGQSIKDLSLEKLQAVEKELSSFIKENEGAKGQGAYRDTVHDLVAVKQEIKRKEGGSKQIELPIFKDRSIRSVLQAVANDPLYQQRLLNKAETRLLELEQSKKQFEKLQDQDVNRQDLIDLHKTIITLLTDPQFVFKTARTEKQVRTKKSLRDARKQTAANKRALRKLQSEEYKLKQANKNLEALLRDIEMEGTKLPSDENIKIGLALAIADRRLSTHKAGGEEVISGHALMALFAGTDLVRTETLGADIGTAEVTPREQKILKDSQKKLQKALEDYKKAKTPKEKKSALKQMANAVWKTEGRLNKITKERAGKEIIDLQNESQGILTKENIEIGPDKAGDPMDFNRLDIEVSDYKDVTADGSENYVISKVTQPVIKQGNERLQGAKVVLTQAEKFTPELTADVAPTPKAETVTLLPSAHLFAEAEAGRANKATRGLETEDLPMLYNVDKLAEVFEKLILRSSTDNINIAKRNLDKRITAESTNNPILLTIVRQEEQAMARQKSALAKFESEGFKDARSENDWYDQFLGYFNAEYNKTTGKDRGRNIRRKQFIREYGNGDTNVALEKIATELSDSPLVPKDMTTREIVLTFGNGKVDRLDPETTAKSLVQVFAGDPPGTTREKVKKRNIITRDGRESVSYMLGDIAAKSNYAPLTEVQIQKMYEEHVLRERDRRIANAVLSNDDISKVINILESGTAKYSNTQIGKNARAHANRYVPVRLLFDVEQDMPSAKTFIDNAVDDILKRDDIYLDTIHDQLSGRPKDMGARREGTPRYLSNLGASQMFPSFGSKTGSIMHYINEAHDLIYGTASAKKSLEAYKKAKEAGDNLIDENGSSAFDATTSGMNNLIALLASVDPEFNPGVFDSGVAVKPMDRYLKLRDMVGEVLTNEADTSKGATLWRSLRIFEDENIISPELKALGRKISKLPIMTKPYGITRGGIANQIGEFLSDGINQQRLRKEIPDLPQDIFSDQNINIAVDWLQNVLDPDAAYVNGVNIPHGLLAEALDMPASDKFLQLLNDAGNKNVANYTDVEKAAFREEIVKTLAEEITANKAEVMNRIYDVDRLLQRHSEITGQDVANVRKQYEKEMAETEGMSTDEFNKHIINKAPMLVLVMQELSKTRRTHVRKGLEFQAEMVGATDADIDNWFTMNGAYKDAGQRTISGHPFWYTAYRADWRGRMYAEAGQGAGNPQSGSANKMLDTDENVVAGPLKTDADGKIISRPGGTHQKVLGIFNDDDIKLMFKQRDGMKRPTGSLREEYIKAGPETKKLLEAQVRELAVKQILQDMAHEFDVDDVLTQASPEISPESSDPSLRDFYDHLHYETSEALRRRKQEEQKFIELGGDEYADTGKLSEAQLNYSEKHGNPLLRGASEGYMPYIDLPGEEGFTQKSRDGIAAYAPRWSWSTDTELLGVPSLKHFRTKQKFTKELNEIESLKQEQALLEPDELPIINSSDFRVYPFDVNKLNSIAMPEGDLGLGSSLSKQDGIGIQVSDLDNARMNAMLVDNTAASLKFTLTNFAKDQGLDGLLKEGRFVDIYSAYLTHTAIDSSIDRINRNVYSLTDSADDLYRDFWGLMNQGGVTGENVTLGSTQQVGEEAGNMSWHGGMFDPRHQLSEVQYVESGLPIDMLLNLDPTGTNLHPYFAGFQDRSNFQLTEFGRSALGGVDTKRLDRSLTANKVHTNDAAVIQLTVAQHRKISLSEGLLGHLRRWSELGLPQLSEKAIVGTNDINQITSVAPTFLSPSGLLVNHIHIEGANARFTKTRLDATSDLLNIKNRHLVQAMALARMLGKNTTVYGRPLSNRLTLPDVDAKFNPTEFSKLRETMTLEALALEKLDPKTAKQDGRIEQHSLSRIKIGSSNSTVKFVNLSGTRAGEARRILLEGQSTKAKREAEAVGIEWNNGVSQTPPQGVIGVGRYGYLDGKAVDELVPQIVGLMHMNASKGSNGFNDNLMNTYLSEQKTIFDSETNRYKNIINEMKPERAKVIREQARIIFENENRMLRESRDGLLGVFGYDHAIQLYEAADLTLDNLKDLLGDRAREKFNSEEVYNQALQRTIDLVEAEMTSSLNINYIKKYLKDPIVTPAADKFSKDALDAQMKAEEARERGDIEEAEALERIANKKITATNPKYARSEEFAKLGDAHEDFNNMLEELIENETLTEEAAGLIRLALANEDTDLEIMRGVMVEGVTKIQSKLKNPANLDLEGVVGLASVYEKGGKHLKSIQLLKGRMGDSLRQADIVLHEIGHIGRAKFIETNGAEYFAMVDALDSTAGRQLMKDATIAMYGKFTPEAKRAYEAFTSNGKEGIDEFIAQYFSYSVLNRTLDANSIKQVYNTRRGLLGKIGNMVERIMGYTFRRMLKIQAAFAKFGKAEPAMLEQLDGIVDMMRGKAGPQPRVDTIRQAEYTRRDREVDFGNDYKASLEERLHKLNKDAESNMSSAELRAHEVERRGVLNELNTYNTVAEVGYIQWLYSEIKRTEQQLETVQSKGSAGQEELALIDRITRLENEYDQLNVTFGDTNLSLFAMEDILKRSDYPRTDKGEPDWTRMDDAQKQTTIQYLGIRMLENQGVAAKGINRFVDAMRVVNERIPISSISNFVLSASQWEHTVNSKVPLMALITDLVDPNVTFLESRFQDQKPTMSLRHTQSQHINMLGGLRNTLSKAKVNFRKAGLDNKTFSKYMTPFNEEDTTDPTLFMTHIAGIAIRSPEKFQARYGTNGQGLWTAELPNDQYELFMNSIKELVDEYKFYISEIKRMGEAAGTLSKERLSKIEDTPLKFSDQASQGEGFQQLIEKLGTLYKQKMIDSENLDSDTLELLGFFPPMFEEPDVNKTLNSFAHCPSTIRAKILELGFDIFKKRHQTAPTPDGFNIEGALTDPTGAELDKLLADAVSNIPNAKFQVINEGTKALRRLIDEGKFTKNDLIGSEALDRIGDGDSRTYLERYEASLDNPDEFNVRNAQSTLMRLTESVNKFKGSPRGAAQLKANSLLKRCESGGFFFSGDQFLNTATDILDNAELSPYFETNLIRLADGVAAGIGWDTISTYNLKNTTGISGLKFPELVEGIGRLARGDATGIDSNELHKSIEHGIKRYVAAFHFAGGRQPTYTEEGRIMLDKLAKHTPYLSMMIYGGNLGAAQGVVEGPVNIIASAGNQAIMHPLQTLKDIFAGFKQSDVRNFAEDYAFGQRLHQDATYYSRELSGAQGAIDVLNGENTMTGETVSKFSIDGLYRAGNWINEKTGIKSIPRTIRAANAKRTMRRLINRMDAGIKLATKYNDMSQAERNAITTSEFKGMARDAGFGNDFMHAQAFIDANLLDVNKLTLLKEAIHRHRGNIVKVVDIRAFELEYRERLRLNDPNAQDFREMIDAVRFLVEQEVDKTNIEPRLLDQNLVHRSGWNRIADVFLQYGRSWYAQKIAGAAGLSTGALLQFYMATIIGENIYTTLLDLARGEDPSRILHEWSRDPVGKSISSSLRVPFFGNVSSYAQSLFDLGRNVAAEQDLGFGYLRAQPRIKIGSMPATAALNKITNTFTALTKLAPQIITGNLALDSQKMADLGTNVTGVIPGMNNILFRIMANQYYAEQRKKPMTPYPTSLKELQRNFATLDAKDASLLRRRMKERGANVSSTKRGIDYTPQGSVPFGGIGGAPYSDYLEQIQKPYNVPSEKYRPAPMPKPRITQTQQSVIDVPSKIKPPSPVDALQDLSKPTTDTDIINELEKLQ